MVKDEIQSKEYIEGYEMGRDIRINGKSEFYLRNITKLKFKEEPNGTGAKLFEDGLYEGYKSIN